MLDHLHDVRGCASVLWHNDRFDPVYGRGWDRLYERLLDGIAERGGHAGTARRADRLLAGRAMRVLIVSFYFPPAGGGGVQRVLKLCRHLPELGVDVDVLAPDDPKWSAVDPGLAADIPRRDDRAPRPLPRPVARADARRAPGRGAGRPRARAASGPARPAPAAARPRDRVVPRCRARRAPVPCASATSTSCSRPRRPTRCTSSRRRSHGARACRTWPISATPGSPTRTGATSAAACAPSARSRRASRAAPCAASPPSAP